MKKLLAISALLLCSRLLQAQADSTAERGHAFLIGIGSSAGVLLTPPDAPHGYDELVNEAPWYCGVRAEVGMLWKEKIGFRIIAGRIGRKSSSFGYNDYTNANYTGYHLLLQYSDTRAGCNYSYITPQFIYKIGTEPFNVLLSGGAGYGRLQNPYATAELQHTGDNDYTQVNLKAENPWCMNMEAGADVAYMRQITPHWFANVGVYVNCTSVFANYNVHYTEQPYAQPVSVDETFNVKQNMIHLNMGIFINYQWNQRESERAFYY